MFFRRFKKTIRNILIVEDEPLVAFDNELHLEEAGYKVVATLDNAAEAMSWMEKEQVQLVLADIRLRGGDSGVDVAKAAHDRGIAVLFATGACPKEARELAAGCLTKPYSAKELVRAVQAVDLLIRGEKLKSMPRALTLYHPVED
ncbi:response regulator [Sphingorhabdus sp. Alg239-R122]|uniref:response regulator n=1 Tax=Sphingorhabdus sp. Alg239-R122 TaxID=2305989 RepID=UPI0013D9B100|nr:response regulator [Sphingorhabdus sp. Alg239-R122]